MNEFYYIHYKSSIVIRTNTDTPGIEIRWYEVRYRNHLSFEGEGEIKEDLIAGGDFGVEVRGPVLYTERYAGDQTGIDVIGSFIATLTGLDLEDFEFSKSGVFC